MKTKERDKTYTTPAIETIPENLLSAEEERVYIMLNSVQIDEEELLDDVAPLDEETYYDLSKLQALLYASVTGSKEEDPVKLKEILQKLSTKE